MSTASSDDTPGDDTPPPGSDEPSRSGFHQRDPAAIAEEAALGEDGPTQVALVQDFYRQMFELVGDEAWRDDPVGPLGNQWRGVGGAQSTYYLMNIANRDLGADAKRFAGCG